MGTTVDPTHGVTLRHVYDWMKSTSKGCVRSGHCRFIQFTLKTFKHDKYNCSRLRTLVIEVRVAIVRS